MMEQSPKVKCPLCEGHGEMTRAQLAQNLTSLELRKRLDARIAEILDDEELAAVGTRTRNFEKEVHTWNPQLPMWRRSPKE